MRTLSLTRALVRKALRMKRDYGDYCGFTYHENSSNPSMHDFVPDFVDEWLGSRYRQETCQVLKNLRCRLPNTAKPRPHHFVDILLPEALLTIIVDFCNKRLTQQRKEQTSTDGFRLCIIAYCRIVDLALFASRSVVAQRPLLGPALLVTPFGNSS